MNTARSGRRPEALEGTPRPGLPPAAAAIPMERPPRAEIGPLGLAPAQPVLQLPSIPD